MEFGLDPAVSPSAPRTAQNAIDELGRKFAFPHSALVLLP